MPHYQAKEGEHRIEKALNPSGKHSTWQLIKGRWEYRGAVDEQEVGDWAREKDFLAENSLYDYWVSNRKEPQQGMTQFGFQFDEKTLDELQAEIKRKKAQSADIGYIIEISVDLIPDGVGYEAGNLKVSIIAKKEDMNKTSRIVEISEKSVSTSRRSRRAGQPS